MRFRLRSMLFLRVYLYCNTLAVSGNVRQLSAGATLLLLSAASVLPRGLLPVGLVGGALASAGKQRVLLCFCRILLMVQTCSRLSGRFWSCDGTEDLHCLELTIFAQPRNVNCRLPSSVAVYTLVHACNKHWKREPVRFASFLVCYRCVALIVSRPFPTHSPSCSEVRFVVPRASPPAMPGQARVMALTPLGLLATFFPASLVDIHSSTFARQRWA